MIKTRIAALVLAASLAGCATTPTSTTTAAVVTQVQQATVAACGFLPVASVVANVIASFAGGSSVVGIVEQVAQEICTAAASLKSARLRGQRAPLVRGVPLRGQFVR